MPGKISPSSRRENRTPSVASTRETWLIGDCRLTAWVIPSSLCGDGWFMKLSGTCTYHRLWGRRFSSTPARRTGTLHSIRWDQTFYSYDVKNTCCLCRRSPWVPLLTTSSLTPTLRTCTWAAILWRVACSDMNLFPSLFTLPLRYPPSIFPIVTWKWR